MTDQEMIGELYAIEQIRQLAYRYVQAWFDRDFDRLLSLWAETGSPPVSLPAMDINFIRDGLLPYRDVVGPNMIHVTNHVIDIVDPTNATGEVYSLAQFDLGSDFVDQAIVYRDRYVCEDGRWLFAVREHLLWYGQDRERHPFEQEAAEWPRRQVGRGVLLDEERRESDAR